VILDKIIRNIYPNVVNILFETDGTYSATDATGNNVALDVSLIKAEYDSQQYARDRVTDWMIYSITGLTDGRLLYNSLRISTLKEVSNGCSN